MTGYCDAAVLRNLSNTLQTEYNAQLLVAAVNGINGGPAGFNYNALASIATVRRLELIKNLFLHCARAESAQRDMHFLSANPIAVGFVRRLQLGGECCPRCDYVAYGLLRLCL